MVGSWSSLSIFSAASDACVDGEVLDGRRTAGVSSSCSSSSKNVSGMGVDASAPLTVGWRLADEPCWGEEDGIGDGF